jgi:hypothetical protein
MAYLKLEIDVENPDEIIKNHKGQLLGLASLLVRKGRKKRAIQKEIYNQIIDELSKELQEQFKKEGVVATVNLSIEEEGKTNKEDNNLENIL